MRALVFFSFLLALLVLQEKVWSQNKYQYLINATNKIMELNGRSSVSTEDSMSAAAEVCQTLKQLLEDRQFRGDLHVMAEIRGKYPKELGELRGNLSLFAQAFLTPEEQTLKNAGLREEAAKQILWSASLFRNAVEDKIDPERILSEIDTLRDEVCEAEKAIRSAQDAGQRREILATWAFRVGGIALIVVDVTGASPSGLIAVGSAAIGTAVAGWK